MCSGGGECFGGEGGALQAYIPTCVCVSVCVCVCVHFMELALRQSLAFCYAVAVTLAVTVNEPEEGKHTCSAATPLLFPFCCGTPWPSILHWKSL